LFLHLYICKAVKKDAEPILKLDPIDLMILKELNQDGRASLREVARRASLSTPTVSSRFERMKHSGLIQKFAPVLDLEASENSGVIAFVNLKAPSFQLDKIATALSHRPEVFGVFMTTGSYNLIVKLSLPNAHSLQRFLTGSELKKLDVEVEGSQIVTKTVKDDHPLPFASQFEMKLKCDLCKGEITSSHPYSIKVASIRYYFCCKTCRRTYLDRHASRIRALNKSTKDDTV
jgi:DNA-binding Lrp family transcriptional regulator/YHS domain-containing protein